MRRSRRIHVAQVRTGTVRLSPEAAHHACHVLRLRDGETVEAFDDAGRNVPGVLRITGECVELHIAEQPTDPSPARAVTVASAVPKGERADWMVEKLSELGVIAFIPLRTERSVVTPSGTSKLQRWRRIAEQSAGQSRRAGVMRIGELRGLDEALRDHAGATILAAVTEAPGEPIVSVDGPDPVLLLIGPEGGWSDAELARFAEAKVRAVRLTGTILRVETAAVVAAAAVILRTCASEE